MARKIIRVAMIVENSLNELLERKRRYVILEGSCLDQLKKLPDSCVQMCVTSPPYWGLRNYSTSPQLWGGSQECEHEWEPTPPRRFRTDHDVINPDSVQNCNKGSNHNLVPTKSCLKCKGWLGELGAEPTPDMFVEHLVMIFHEVRRVLRDDGTLWLNIGDSYSSGGRKSQAKATRGSMSKTTPSRPPSVDGLKPKDLAGIPWMTAFALRKDGWYLRSDIIWAKLNCMPESVQDRPTRSHEYIFLLSKSVDYFYDKEAIAEPITESSKERSKYGWNGRTDDNSGGSRTGSAFKKAAETGEALSTIPESGMRNKRSVWHMSTSGYKEAHFATFNPELPRLCIFAGSSEKGCCPKCYTPYERIIESKSLERYELNPNSSNYRPARYESKYEEVYGNEGTGMRYNFTKTVGWKARCECDAGDPIPCLVLDPFNGSGTTGMVALQNNRVYIACELNPEYIELTKQRFNGGEGSIFDLLGE